MKRNLSAGGSAPVRRTRCRRRPHRFGERVLEVDLACDEPHGRTRRAQPLSYISARSTAAFPGEHRSAAAVGVHYQTTRTDH